MRQIIILFTSILLFSACDDKNDYLVKIKTEHGDMTVLLYDETPLHKKNFLELARAGRYDSTIFHRVSKNFMIQGGNVAEKEGVQESPDDRVPAEIVEGFYHTKGALAAARQGDQVNPEKKSSSSQFYIVHGQPWEMMSTDINTLYGKVVELLQDSSNVDLIKEYQTAAATRDQNKIIDFFLSKKAIAEEKFGISLSMDPNTGNDDAYQKMNGGAPHLDGEYTVFGRVVEGLEIVDIIASLPVTANPQTGEKSKPLEEIPLTMEVLAMDKKEITEKYGYEYPE